MGVRRGKAEDETERQLHRPPAKATRAHRHYGKDMDVNPTL